MNGGISGISVFAVILNRPAATTGAPPREPALACELTRTHPGILQRSAPAVRVHRAANRQGPTETTRKRRYRMT